MGDLRYVDGLILEYLLYTHEDWLAKARTPGFQSDDDAKQAFEDFVKLLQKSGAMPSEASEKKDSTGEQANPGV